MTPIEVLARLRAQKVEVLVEGERIRLRAPVGAITEELRRAVCLHKASLVRLLTGSAPATRAERGLHLLALLRAHCARRSWIAAAGWGELDERRVEHAERPWDAIAREAHRFVAAEEATDVRLRAALARHEALTPVDSRGRMRPNRGRAS